MIQSTGGRERDLNILSNNAHKSMLEFLFVSKGDKMAINVNIMCQLDLLDNCGRSLENEFMRSVTLPFILTFFIKSRNNKDTLALEARAVPELVYTKGEPGSERLF